jgi:hypothetical protein
MDTHSCLKRSLRGDSFQRIRTSLRKIINSGQVANKDEEDVTFLDGIPYIDILGSLYNEEYYTNDSSGGGMYAHNSFFPDAVPSKRSVKNRDVSDVLQFRSPPLVSRVYEEAYMREAIGPTEVGCAMGDRCECMHIDPDNPFLCMRFQLPNIDCDTHIADLNKDIVICVICIRKITQRLFYDVVYKGVTITAVIQLYGNIFGVKGEYSEDVALVCPSGGPVCSMPHPIVSHQRNRYRVVQSGNRRVLEQLRVNINDF